MKKLTVVEGRHGRFVLAHAPVVVPKLDRRPFAQFKLKEGIWLKR